MASKFKVWIHIEEIDEENDLYRDCGEPVEIDVCETEEEAYALADLVYRKVNN